jgi:N-acyl-D-aspartate/D-glutamate deacylase
VNAVTAITNVRVFDGARLGEPATVVVHDAMISGRTQADGAGDAEVVDGRGGTLLPGLIDTHVHVDQAAQLEASASWGVTTVLDMGYKDLANRPRASEREERRQPGERAELRVRQEDGILRLDDRHRSGRRGTLRG